MRNFINIIEGEVVQLPSPKSTGKVRGSAAVYEFARLPQYDDLDEFTRSYIDAALWTDSEQLGEDGIEDVAYRYFHVQTARKMIEDCHNFQSQNAALLDRAYRGGYEESQAGHDFWLTRNRHGAGFWDRDLGSLGRDLTVAAYQFGEVDLYVGDDRAIHQG